MKKAVSLLLAGFLGASIFVGCSPEMKIDESKKDSPKQEEKKEDKKEEAKNPDDVWTYYNGTQWSENYEGLKFEIQKAVVTDKAPASDGSDKKASAVGVKMKVTNTTKGKFTTYPDQAVLVTSTGEQIDTPNMFISTDLGGEIDEGVTKEGDIVWYLNKAGTAKDIKWIKLTWNTHKGPEDKFDAGNKKFEIKLELKQ